MLKNGLGWFKGKSTIEPSVWEYGFLSKMKQDEDIVYYIKPDVEIDNSVVGVEPIKEDTICVCSGFLCGDKYIYSNDLLTIEKCFSEYKSKVFCVKAVLKCGGWWLVDLEGIEDDIYLYDISGYNFDGGLDVKLATMKCKNAKYSVIDIVGNAFDSDSKEIFNNLKVY